MFTYTDGKIKYIAIDKCPHCGGQLNTGGDCINCSRNIYLEKKDENTYKGEI